MPVVELIEDAQRTMRAVRRNLCVSLCYNLVGVTLAMTGYISPLMAAIVMPASSVTVLFLALGSGIRRTPCSPVRPTTDSFPPTLRPELQP